MAVQRTQRIVQRQPQPFAGDFFGSLRQRVLPEESQDLRRFPQQRLDIRLQQRFNAVFLCQPFDSAVSEGIDRCLRRVHAAVNPLHHGPGCRFAAHDELDHFLRQVPGQSARVHAGSASADPHGDDIICHAVHDTVQPLSPSFRVPAEPFGRLLSPYIGPCVLDVLVCPRQAVERTGVLPRSLVPQQRQPCADGSGNASDRLRQDPVSDHDGRVFIPAHLVFQLVFVFQLDLLQCRQQHVIVSLCALFVAGQVVLIEFSHLFVRHETLRPHVAVSHGVRHVLRAQVLIRIVIDLINLSAVQPPDHRVRVVFPVPLRCACFQPPNLRPPGFLRVDLVQVLLPFVCVVDSLLLLPQRIVLVVCLCLVFQESPVLQLVPQAFHFCVDGVNVFVRLRRFNGRIIGSVSMHRVKDHPVVSVLCIAVVVIVLWLFPQVICRKFPAFFFRIRQVWLPVLVVSDWQPLFPQDIGFPLLRSGCVPFRLDCRREGFRLLQPPFRCGPLLVQFPVTPELDPLVPVISAVPGFFVEVGIASRIVRVFRSRPQGSPVHLLLDEARVSAHRILPVPFHGQLHEILSRRCCLRLSLLVFPRLRLHPVRLEAGCRRFPVPFFLFFPDRVFHQRLHGFPVSLVFLRHLFQRLVESAVRVQDIQVL